MPDTKVSDEAAASTLAGNERLLGVQSGGNVYVTPDQIVARTGAVTHSAANKPTLVDADELPVADSAASFALKNWTWANVKASIWAALGALIAGGTGKTTPVDADTLALSDSADSAATKKLTWANVKAGIWSALGALIAAGTTKATPVDGDGLALSDSAASGATKLLTWANLKATLALVFSPFAPSITTITYAGTISVDLTGKPNGALFRCTLTGNVTVNFTGGTDGQKCVLELLQDGTGSRLVTLGTAVGYGTDIAAFTASTAASKTDVLGFIYNSTASKYRLVAVTKGY